VAEIGEILYDPAGRITVRVEDADREAIAILSRYLASLGPYRPYAGSVGESVRFALRIAVAHLAERQQKEEQSARRMVRRVKGKRVRD